MSHEYFYGTLLCCRRRARRVTTPRPRRRTQNKPSLAGDYAGYTGAEESAVHAEVTETVKEVQESMLPALASGMGNAGYAEEEAEVTETVTEAQEPVLPAQDEVAGDDADNGAGKAGNIVTEASSSTVGQSGKAVKRYKCTVCEKSYARIQYLR